MPSPAVSSQNAAQGVERNLRRTVAFLSQEVGPRSLGQPEKLDQAADRLLEEFKSLGYEVSVQTYSADGRSVRNVIAEKRGSSDPERVWIVGAHYDTVPETPGADDNASGVAVLLELARLRAQSPPACTFRFVAFTLEEPPHFKTGLMGSRVYAASLKERGEKIEGMICLESVGYYSDEPNSQDFPLFPLKWIYPDRGNFVTLVSNLHSGRLANRIEKSFKKTSPLAMEVFAGPVAVTGTDWSDHDSFWRAGYRAVMLTDTAPFRNPNYHEPTDRIETLDFLKMTRLTLGLSHVLEELDR